MCSRFLRTSRFWNCLCFSKLIEIWWRYHWLENVNLQGCCGKTPSFVPLGIASSVNMLEKKFQCTFEECGYKCFPTKQILENHIRTHTGEKPFQCSDCGASFTTLTNKLFWTTAMARSEPRNQYNMKNLIFLFRICQNFLVTLLLQPTI